MAQLASQADGAGHTSSVTVIESDGLTLGAVGDGDCHTVFLEWTPDEGTSWIRMTGSLIDLSRRSSGSMPIALYDGIEVRADIRGGGADVWLESSST
jgi:hypothetical protein